MLFDNKKYSLTFMEKIDIELFNRVRGEAEVSSRLRMNYDLRTQASDSDPLWRDGSQRMLNVMMKGRTDRRL